MKKQKRVMKKLFVLLGVLFLFHSYDIKATELNESVSDNQISEIVDKELNLSSEEVETENSYVDWGVNNHIEWSLDSDGKLTIKGYGDLNTQAEKVSNSNGLSDVKPNTPWDKYRNEVTSLYVDVYDVKTADFWFYMFCNLRDVNIVRMDMGMPDGQTVSMYGLFAGCSTLEELDLSHVNTSRVTDMTYMFLGCKSLKNLQISEWDTGNVRNMDGMFYNCQSLTNLSLSKWKVDKVVSMYSMFRQCLSLQYIDLSGWNTGNVIKMSFMFCSCYSLQSLDVSGFDTKNVTAMEYMFERCNSLKVLDVSNFDFSRIKCDYNNFSDYINVICDFQALGNLDVIIFPENLNIAFELPSYTMYVTKGGKFSSTVSNKSYYGPDGLIHDTVITGLPYKAAYSIYPNYTFIQGFASRMYTTVLNRPAESEGLYYWTMALINHEVDGAGIAKGFICSNEFKNRNLNNSDYVNVLYQTFFDREPDAEGKNYWMSLLNSGTNRYYVLSQFVNSQEFSEICSMYGIDRGVMWSSSVNEKGVRDYVLRMYTKALDRVGEADGVNYWSECIIAAESTAEEVAKSFFHSQEFLNKNLSDPDYVETLYATYFDRVSDTEGKAYWLNQMQNGMSRDDVLTEFAYSREFKQIMSGYGL